MQAPSNIQVKKADRLLRLLYGEQWLEVEFELLRVCSPSAEVKGHGGEGGELPFGKRLVDIDKIEPVGNYAIRIFFNDGHNSGLFGWDYLYDLASNKETHWQEYEAELVKLGKSRDAMFIQLKNL